MAETCPKCGKSKGITKVSAIIKKEEDLELIKRLAAPRDPQKSIKSFGARDSLIFIALAFTTTTFLLSMQNKSMTAMVIYGVFTLFFVVGVVRLFLNYSRTRKVAEALTPGWRDAQVIWNRLYYCYDEDLVFDSKTREFCAPEEYHQTLLHYPPEIPGITAPKKKK